ncbi:MAG: hypothetical protein EPO24_02840 [Bacteroidetes bacterium]|nr:MAG: hypothetical protein EPO24_02840 [Bacteroidota bacterium]
MSLILLVNKSAPDITDFVLVVIGLLLALLAIDLFSSYLKRKYQEKKEKANQTEEVFFQKEMGDSPPLKPPEE